MPPVKTFGERIADALLEDGLLSSNQFEELQEQQKAGGVRLLKLLVEKSYVSEFDLAVSMGRVLSVPPVNLGKISIPVEVADLLPREIGFNHKVIPVAKLENKIFLAMADPLNVLALDDVRRITRHEVAPMIASEKAIVDKLNSMDAARTGSLEDIIKSSKGVLFNQAAQHWNHSFYWNCLSPKGGGEAGGAVGDAIKSTWGSFDAFKDEFTKTAIGTFGSGWAWLVREADGKLAITSTKDADLPLAHGQHALLTCDVWEHAYYVDYRNARPKYVEEFWKLVNWDFVASNLAG